MDSLDRLRPYLGLACKVALFVGFLVLASRTGNWVFAQLTPHLMPGTEPSTHRLIMVAISAYVLLMMLPFVPGVEIGLGMMMMFGPNIAPLVYGATVVALVLSFLAGRLVPQEKTASLFRTLGLRRTANLLDELLPLGPNARVAYLLRGASTRIVPFLLRHRVIALMVALNLPGNAVLGGGGGICLAAGFSRLFSFPTYLMAVLIAVAPVPALVYMTGTIPY